MKFKKLLIIYKLYDIKVSGGNLFSNKNIYVFAKDFLWKVRLDIAFILYCKVSCF